MFVIVKRSTNEVYVANLSTRVAADGYMKRWDINANVYGVKLAKDVR